MRLNRILGRACSDYKEPDECGRDYNCHYDYDEKECRNKRSPTNFTRSPYYQVSTMLPIESHKNIYSYLYGPGPRLRLVEYYPHNTQYIMENIVRVPTEEVIELLNYLPDTIDLFAIRLYQKLQSESSRTDLLGIISHSGNMGFLMMAEPFTVEDANTVMNVAAQAGNRDIVELMIDLGNVDLNDALRWAAGGGHMDIVQMLVEAGATDFDRAMYMAAWKGHRDIVIFMLDKGATQVYNAILAARWAGHHDIVEILQRSIR